MRRVRSACCARAAIGHVAAPPSRAMNSPCRAERLTEKATFLCDALETDGLAGAAGFEPLHLRIDSLIPNPSD